ncbi:unnamed protein product [Paramecium primaurelia]|uniref:Transmembrane protein n=1 Tax=Paramecium primaurelia TaxID=5886 RepID=A0A8S1JTY7_PARPR|nr:unnamed protein product [Paramecium primaurelia]
MLFGIISLILHIESSYQWCVTNQENVTYYTSKGEQIRWRADSLISGNGLEFTLIPNSTIMRYHPAFDQISAEETHFGTLIQTGAIRAYDIASSGAWTNQFAFLELDDKKNIYDIYYAVGSALQMDKTPQFYQKVVLTKSNAVIDCFDIEYINPDLWIVDCAEKNDNPPTQPMKNFIYFVEKTDSPDVVANKRQEVANHKQYKQVKGRKIQYHVYYKKGTAEENGVDRPQPPSPIRILLRGQQAFNSETGNTTVLDNDCSIDLLIRLDNGTLKDTSVLDKTKISEDTKQTVNFTLIDFKVQPNGDVYILDADWGIYLYKVTEEGQWVYVKTIQTLNQKAYGFDVVEMLNEDGYYELAIAVLYESNLLITVASVQKNGYNLPFKASFPVTVSFSDKYVVVVHQQRLYLYNIFMPFLLHSEILISSTILVNPYAPDVIVVSNTLTRRYELSDGYLASENSVQIEKSTITLYGTDGTKTCSCKINYQVLPVDDTNIYELGHDPFPNMITYPAEPFLLQDLASGPNLKYITPDVSQDHVEVLVHFLWELELRNVTFFDAKDVAYADILVDPHHHNNNKYYLFLQHKNKTVVIWDCQSYSFRDNHSNCEKQDQFDLPVQLSRTNSQFDWKTFEQEVVTFQFQVNDYEILFYSSYDGDHQKIGNITYEASPEFKITSFTALKQNIYVVQYAQKEVDVIFAVNPTLIKYSIYSNLIDEYETGCSWTPKRVFGNSFTNSEFIFILTDDCVIMGELRTHFVLITVIPIETDAEVEVAVGQKTFYIISKGKKDSIKEYNYENLNDIYPMKSLPLYGRFALQSPLTIDYVFETGFLFVRALDTIEKETVILIYESNILYRNSLHKVLKTHELIPDGQLLETAASGQDQMFVYFNDLKTQRVVVFLKDSLMELIPTKLSDAYTTSLKTAVSISNTLSNSSTSVIYPVKFINTQSIVRINTTLLAKTTFHFDSTSNTQYLNFTNDGLYFGHVTKFKIICKQCDGKLISIINPLTQSSEGTQFANYEIITGATFKDTVVYLADPKSLIFQNSDDDTVKFVHKIEPGTHCTQLSTYNEYVFVTCINNADTLVYIANCDISKSTCTPIQSDSPNIGKFNIVSKILYSNSYLYILDADPDHPLSNKGVLHVYQLTLDQKWSVKNEKVFDEKYFSLPSINDYYITDFDVVQFQQGNTFYQKIMIQTAIGSNYFVQMYNDGGLLKDNHKQIYNLAQFLNKDYAIKDNTNFFQIRTYKSVTNSNTLDVTVIVTTNNVAQYAITFSFDISDPLNKGSPIKDTIVPFLLNQYGTMQTLNKLVIGLKHAAVPYYNSSHLMISMYQLPELTGLGADTKAKMLTITGAEIVKHIASNTQFALVIQKPSNQIEPSCYTNIEEDSKTNNYVVKKYTIHDVPKIKIVSGDKVLSQIVELQIENDYSSALGAFEIINNNTPPPPPDDDNSGSSLLWLWILLGIIGGIAILGGAFFVYIKFFKKTTNVSSSAKVSLMNQQ